MVYGVLMLMAVFLVCAGCGGQKSASQEGAQKFRIVTSFYPMYIATLNITEGIDGVEVVNMTKPQTGCLHDYQLTTEDMKKLEKANAFVVNGGGMESFLDKVIQQQKKLQIVDASEGIPLLMDGDEPNPHVWVSVTNSIVQVKNISRRLAELDPKHADAYEKNASAYVDKLEALKTEMHAELDTLPQRDIVTFHEAFPYFAQEFNLHIVSVVEREPGTEPSPRELEETVAQVRKLPVRVLFTEPQYSRGAADTIARETGAFVYALDPVVTGDADDSARDAYLHAMERNACVLKTALSEDQTVKP